MDANIVVTKGDLPEGVTFPNGAVAVDTETLGLNLMRDRLCVCQLSDGQGNVWLVQFDGTEFSNPAAAPRLKAVLADPRLLKIFHYGRFDIAVLKRDLGVLCAPVFCTKVASKLTRTYTDRHGLKDLVQELVGISLDKQQQTSFWAAPELSPEQRQYAASDVLYLHKAKEVLEERLRLHNRLHLAQQCFAYLPARAELDLLGWEDTDIFAHN
jgi:ribonuclease D